MRNLSFTLWMLLWMPLNYYLPKFINKYFLKVVYADNFSTAAVDISFFLLWFSIGYLLYEKEEKAKGTEKEIKKEDKEVKKNEDKKEE